MQEDLTYMVVIDPTLQHQPAFERSMQSAKMSGAKLHLFQCVYYDNAISVDGDDDEQKKQIIEYYSNQLDRLKTIAEHMDVVATTEIQWSQAWGRAVVDAAASNDIFMVFKSSYFHTNAERSESTADYTLLRECHCPVLLMHHTSLWSTRSVLAAINLAAEDKDHLSLNQKVIDIASSFSSSFNAEVHFVNAVRPETKEHIDHIINDDDDMLVNLPPSVAVKGIEHHQIDEAYMMEVCNADKDHVHVVEGDPTEAIVTTADKLDVDLIVVGNAARKGIKGRVIGNTAEKLLDRTKHDILALSLGDY